MTEAKYFAQIKQGSCFAYKHELFIKTIRFDVDGSYFNCVNLRDGNLSYVGDDELVIPQDPYGAPV